ncbi:MAG: glutamyl-tRNA reductase [Burkholderiales bacterium]|nr:glutamyl-tRNA reductase [Burkholderiales bacterium]
MHLFAFGINHQTAPLSVREQVAFCVENVEHALRDLVKRQPVKEAAIVSTCNRTEVYCHTAEPARAIDWLADYHHLPAHDLEPYLYTLPRELAVQHAFRVASGLDSMILGEPQILGQLKQAVKAAEHAGTLGYMLHKLFQRTFSVAKEVRTRTDIGANSVSMAAAAVRLAERIFPSIAGQNILLVGVGEMIELCATHFAARNPARMTFANRSPERGIELAKRHGADLIALSDMPDRLAAYDIIVSSTASALPIIGKGMVESALKLRRHRPILMVDLAVPRDIEPEVAELEDVFLFSVDDLGRAAQEGLDARRAAVAQAEAIIACNVDDFVHWMEAREVVPTIRALRESAEATREAELERALRALAGGADPQTVMDRLSRALTNKFLHTPNQMLNEANPEDREEMMLLLQRLYRIKPE